jgi:hypothetical protein
MRDRDCQRADGKRPEPRPVILHEELLRLAGVFHDADATAALRAEPLPLNNGEWDRIPF